MKDVWSGLLPQAPVGVAGYLIKLNLPGAGNYLRVNQDETLIFKLFLFNEWKSTVFLIFQAERDGLAEARRELERKLESKQLELHEKEEELFLQLERVVRLEEDCEKVGLILCRSFARV